MPDDALGVIGHALNRSGVMAEMAMRKAEGDERPAKVLLLDDWTVYGNTAKRGKRSLEEMLGDKDKLTFMLGTMTGNERTDMRHVVGYSGKMSVPWADDSDLIGVIYSYYNPKDFRRNQSLVWPEPVRTKYARRLRQDLTWYVKRQIVPSPYEGSSTQLTPWKRVGFALRRGFKRIVNTSL